ncbi:7,8-dihydro-6-hydroxymethylpterin dimethyltransferase [uncultured archaeon]|nr:7,8-dihydro-6-hydroxymethylpterin dimethyltransferase [uncultured archaeon]
MKISSHQETTIDYPGKMGQILFVSGCNFKCGFCHNPELVEGKINEINLEALLKNINSKAKTGWYQGICISGGEPTIYSDLPGFARRLKDMGLSVKLDTNGSNPEMLRELLKEETIDYVAMDIKGPREKYHNIVNVNGNLKLENIDKSIRLVKLFPNYEFRTTILPDFTTEDIEKIGTWACFGRETDNTRREAYQKVNLYTLQQYNPKKTLDPQYGKLSPKPSREIFELKKIMDKYSEFVRVLV